MAIELRNEPRPGATIDKLVFAVTAEQDGTVASFALPPIEGSLLALATTPGTPSPDGFDVTLKQDGYDVLESCGLARLGDRPTRVIVKFPHTSPSVHQTVALCDVLVLHVTGNTRPNARLTIGLYLGRPWRV